MSGFLNDVGILKLDRRVRTRPVYRTQGRLRYEAGFSGSGLVFEVPENYETDLVSAPWVVKWLMPVKSMRRPAILHDYLRASRFDLELWRTDLIFLEAMCAEGVSVFWRLASYLAVQISNTRVGSPIRPCR